MTQEGRLVQCYRPVGMRHTKQVLIEVQIFIACHAIGTLKFLEVIHRDSRVWDLLGHDLK